MNLDRKIYDKWVPDIFHKVVSKLIAHSDNKVWPRLEQVEIPVERLSRLVADTFDSHPGFN